MPRGNAAFNLDSQLGLYVHFVSMCTTREQLTFINTEYGRTKCLSATHSHTGSRKTSLQWLPTSVTYWSRRL